MIDEAKKKAGRTDDVTLLAVTKLHDTWEINEAIKCGVTDIAENKPQEIVAKYEKVDPVRWHLIGHLQTNKVKYIIDKVSMIHSVDSLHLAEEIDRQAKKHGLKTDILIQVNSANEETKFGVKLEETEGLVREILNSFDSIRVRGLMCIAPYAEDPNDVKKYFVMVKEKFEELKAISHENLDLKYLSMGMSNDFTVAIEAGSNIVRVGTMLFGQRNYSKKQGE